MKAGRPTGPRPQRYVFWGLLLSFGLGGCGTFAFYEDSKVAIAISIDPKAPDPVEITAAFKESIYALVPLRQVTDPADSTGKTKHYEVGSVFSDFDVRYGRYGGGETGAKDILFASINHGLATGPAGKILAARTPDELLARKIVITSFIRSLKADEVSQAATALNLAGPGRETTETVQNRVLLAVQLAGADGVGAMEIALKGRFSSFKKWGG